MNSVTGNRMEFLGIVACLLLAACAQLPSSGTNADTDRAGATRSVATSATENFQVTLPKGAVKNAEVVEELPEISEDSTVFFSLGSAALNYQEKRKLETLAEQLIDNPNQFVTLIGHANDNGSSSYNLAVSDSRVTTVFEFLHSHGIPHGRIRKEAVGGEKIPVSCRSLECRKKSRRVNIIISKAK